MKLPSSTVVAVDVPTEPDDQGRPRNARVHVHVSKVWPHDEEDETGVNTDNIIDIKYLHEPSVLHSLGLRFSRNLVYTFSGPVLLSVNPFQVLQDVRGSSFYGPRQMARVRIRPSGAEVGTSPGSEDDEDEHTPPHVFCMADDAYRRLQRDGLNQSIVFLGPVGSGRSSAMVQCLSYLAHLAALDAVIFNSSLLEAADAIRSGKVVPPGSSSAAAYIAEVDDEEEDEEGGGDSLEGGLPPSRSRSGTVQGGMRAINVSNRQSDLTSDDYGLSMSRRKGTISGNKSRLTTSLMASASGRKLLSGGVGSSKRSRRASSRLSMAFYGGSPVAASMLGRTDVRASIDETPASARKASVAKRPTKRRGISLLLNDAKVDPPSEGSQEAAASSPAHSEGSPVFTGRRGLYITKNNLDEHLAFAAWDGAEGALAAETASRRVSNSAKSSPSAGLKSRSPSPTSTPPRQGTKSKAATASPKESPRKGVESALSSDEVPPELGLLTHSHENKVLAVPGILEPLGTAVTPGGGSSSRYSSVLRLFFRQGSTVNDAASCADFDMAGAGRVQAVPDTSVGLLRGAVLDTLQLERERLSVHTSCSDIGVEVSKASRTLAKAILPGGNAGDWPVDEQFLLTTGSEHGFSVFHNLVAGCSPEEQSHLKLPMSGMQSAMLTPLPVRLLLLQSLWWTTSMQVHRATSAHGAPREAVQPLLKQAVQAVTASFIEGRVLPQSTQLLSPLPVHSREVAADGVSSAHDMPEDLLAAQSRIMDTWVGVSPEVASAAHDGWLASLRRVGMSDEEVAETKRMLAACLALSEIEFTTGSAPPREDGTGGEVCGRVITGPSVSPADTNTILAPSITEAADAAAAAMLDCTAASVADGIGGGGTIIPQAIVSLVLAARAGARFDQAAQLLGISGRQLASALTLQSVRVVAPTGPRSAGGRAKAAGGVAPSVTVLTQPLHLSVAACAERRDQMVQHMYARIFGWVVRRINKCLLPFGGHDMVQHCAKGVPSTLLSPLPPTVPDVYRRSLNSIALVDTLGWEDVNGVSGRGVLGNGFYQLCANYTCELLEELFTRYAVRSQEEVYAAEGIHFHPVSYPGNTAVLEVLDRPSVGLMTLLEDAAMYSRASDEALARKVAATHKRSLAAVSPSSELNAVARVEARVRRRAVPMLFTIRHSHADVTYDLRGALAAHRSELDVEVSLALQCSSWDWMATMFFDPSTPARAEMNAPPLMKPAFDLKLIGDDNTLSPTPPVEMPKMVSSAPPGKGRQRRSSVATIRGAQPSTATMQETVGARFRTGVTALTALAAGPAVQPSFVRCIRPNVASSPGEFSAGQVAEQIRCSGIVPALIHRHSGYVFNTTFQDFYERFVITLPPASAVYRDDSPLTGDEQQQLKRLMEQLPLYARPGQDHKHLCERLLQALWMAHRETLGQYSLAQQVQAGRTKLFTRKEVIQELEALREMALQDMDAAALVLQHHLYAYTVRAQFKKGCWLLLRLQALQRMRLVRNSYRRHRAAAIIIQRRVKTWRTQRGYVALRKAVQALKTKWVAFHMHCRWLRVRRTLRRLHALTLGFYIRTDMARRQNAVRIMQAAAIKFLEKNRLFWAKVHGALLMQAAFRGHSWRKRHRPLVGYVRRRVVATLLTLRLVKAQAVVRGFLARRVFKRLRKAAGSIQTWVRGALVSRGFAVVRVAAPMIQRAVRRHLARRGFRHRQEAHHVAAAAWRVKRVRERELKALAQYSIHTEAVDDAKRGVLAARRYARMLNDANRDRFTLEGGAMEVHMRERDEVGHDFYLARDSYVLDVDAIGDISETYPKGWTHCMASLDLWLRAHAGHVKSIAVGASHTVVLSNTGQVYTFGWGDEGQLGQGYVLEDFIQDADVPGLAEATGEVSPTRGHEEAKAEGGSPSSRGSPRKGPRITRGRFHESTVSRTAKMIPMLPSAAGKNLEASSHAHESFRRSLRSRGVPGSDAGAIRGKDHRAGWGAGVLAAHDPTRTSLGGGSNLRPSVISGGMSGVGMVHLTSRAGGDSDDEYSGPPTGMGRGYTVSGSRATHIRPVRAIIPSRRAQEALGFALDGSSVTSTGFTFGEDFSEGFAAGGSGAAVGGAAATMASTGGMMESAAGGGGLSALRRQQVGVTASGRSLSPPPALFSRAGNSPPGDSGASVGGASSVWSRRSGGMRSSARFAPNALYQGDMSAAAMQYDAPDKAHDGYADHTFGRASTRAAAALADNSMDVSYHAMLQSGLHPQSPVRRALVDSVVKPTVEEGLHTMGHTEAAASMRIQRQQGAAAGADTATPLYRPDGTARRPRRNSWSYSPWLSELRGDVEDDVAWQGGASGGSDRPRGDARVFSLTGAAPVEVDGSTRPVSMQDTLAGRTARRDAAEPQGMQNHPLQRTVFALARPRRRIKYSEGLHEPKMVQSLRHEPGAMKFPLFSLNDGIKITSVVAGAEHTLCLTESNRVFAFGSNAFGQLGLGGDTQVHLTKVRGPDAAITSGAPPVDTCAEPMEIASLKGHAVTFIAAGRYHSMALTKKGQVFTWGRGADCGHGRGYALGLQGKTQHANVLNSGGRITTPATKQRQLGESMVESRRSRREEEHEKPWRSGMKRATTKPRGTKTSRRRETISREKRDGDLAVEGFSQTVADDSVPPPPSQKEPTGTETAGTGTAAVFDSYAALLGIPNFYSPTLLRSLSSQVCTSIHCATGVSAAVTVHGRVYMWGPGWGKAASTAVQVAVQAQGHGSGEAEAAAKHAAEAAAADGTLPPLQPAAVPVCVWPLSADATSQVEVAGFESVLKGGRSAKRPSAKSPPSKEDRQRSARRARFERSVNPTANSSGSAADLLKQARADSKTAGGNPRMKWAGRAVEIALGGRHMLLRTSKDGVWAWGVNSDHQCGVPDAAAVISSPQLVPKLCGQQVRKLAAGWRHSVAVTGDHRVWVWGHVSPSMLPNRPRSALAIGQAVSYTGQAHAPTTTLRPGSNPHQLPAPPAPASATERAASRRERLAEVQSKRSDLLAKSLLHSFMEGAGGGNRAVPASPASSVGTAGRLSKEDELAKHIYEHMIAGAAAQEHADAVIAEAQDDGSVASAGADADASSAAAGEEDAKKDEYEPLAVDQTHVVVSEPVRVPFSSKTRHTVDVVVTCSPSLAITVLGYEHLLLQHTGDESASDSEDDEAWAHRGEAPEEVVDSSVADQQLLLAVADTETKAADQFNKGARRSSHVQRQAAALVRRAHDESGGSPPPPAHSPSSSVRFSAQLRSPDLRDEQEQDTAPALHGVTEGGINPHANATGGVMGFVGVDRYKSVSTSDVRGRAALLGGSTGRASISAGTALWAKRSEQLLPVGWTLDSAQERVLEQRAERVQRLRQEMASVDMSRYFVHSPTQRALAVLDEARVPDEDDPSRSSIDLSRVPPVTDLSIACALAMFVDRVGFSAAVAEAVARIAGAGSEYLTEAPPVGLLLPAWNDKAAAKGHDPNAMPRSSMKPLKPKKEQQLLELVIASPAAACLQAQGIAVFNFAGRDADRPYWYGDGTRPVSVAQRRMALLPIGDLLTGFATMHARFRRLGLRLWTVRRLATSAVSSPPRAPPVDPRSARTSPPAWVTAPLTPAQLVPELPPSLLSIADAESAAAEDSASDEETRGLPGAERRRAKSRTPVAAAPAGRRDSIIAVAAGDIARAMGSNAQDEIPAHSLLGGPHSVAVIRQRDWRMSVLFSPCTLVAGSYTYRIRGHDRQGGAFDQQREEDTKALVMQRERAQLLHAWLEERRARAARVGLLGAGRQQGDGASDFRRALLQRSWQEHIDRRRSMKQRRKSQAQINEKRRQAAEAASPSSGPRGPAATPPSGPTSSQAPSPKGPSRADLDEAVAAANAAADAAEAQVRAQQAAQRAKEQEEKEAAAAAAAKRQAEAAAQKDAADEAISRAAAVAAAAAPKPLVDQRTKDEVSQRIRSVIGRATGSTPAASGTGAGSTALVPSGDDLASSTRFRVSSRVAATADEIWNSTTGRASSPEGRLSRLRQQSQQFLESTRPDTDSSIAQVDLEALREAQARARDRARAAAATSAPSDSPPPPAHTPAPQRQVYRAAVQGDFSEGQWAQNGATPPHSPHAGASSSPLQPGDLATPPRQGSGGHDDMSDSVLSAETRNSEDTPSPQRRPLPAHLQRDSAPLPRMQLPRSTALPQPRRRTTGTSNSRIGANRVRAGGAKKMPKPSPGPPLGSPPGLGQGRGGALGSRRDPLTGIDQPVLPPQSPGRSTTSPGASKSPGMQRADSPLWNAGGSYLNAYRTGAPTAHLEGVSDYAASRSQTARQAKHAVFSDSSGMQQQRRSGAPPPSQHPVSRGQARPTQHSTAANHGTARIPRRSRQDERAASSAHDELLQELEADSSMLLQTVSASDALHQTPRRR